MAVWAKNNIYIYFFLIGVKTGNNKCLNIYFLVFFLSGQQQVSFSTSTDKQKLGALFPL